MQVSNAKMPIFTRQRPDVRASKDEEKALESALREDPKKAWESLSRYHLRSPQRIYLLSKFVDLPPPIGESALDFLIGELKILQSHNTSPESEITDAILRCHARRIASHPADPGLQFVEFSDVADAAMREWFGLRSSEWLVRGCPSTLETEKSPPDTAFLAIQKCTDLFRLGIGDKMQARFLRIFYRNQVRRGAVGPLPKKLIEAMVFFIKTNKLEEAIHQEECRSLLAEIGEI